MTGMLGRSHNTDIILSTFNFISVYSCKISYGFFDMYSYVEPGKFRASETISSKLLSRFSKHGIILRYFRLTFLL